MSNTVVLLWDIKHTALFWKKLAELPVGLRLLR